MPGGIKKDGDRKLKWPKTLYIIGCALLIAITSGFIFQFLDAKGLIEKNKNTREIKGEFSILKDLRARLKSRRASSGGITETVKGIISGSVSLGEMVLWWILIGVGLASLSAAYIPANIFQNYMGPTVLGLFATLLVATVLEVCSEGSAPLAPSGYRTPGRSPGLPGKYNILTRGEKSFSYQSILN